MQREVRADADRHRQVLALLLRALERRLQVAAEIELDAGAVGTGQHQAVVRGVVDAGLGIARDNDAGGDVAAGVGGGMGERRQQLAEVDAGLMDFLLHGRPLDQHRGLGLAQRATDKLPHAAEVDAEGGLHVGLARQQIADHRHVVALDLREQHRRPAVELLHDAGDVEIRIGRCGVGMQAAVFRHAVQRRAKASVQDRIRYTQRSLPRWQATCLVCIAWHHTCAARTAPMTLEAT